jgi:rhodanese-related sulfurtransferase
MRRAVCVLGVSLLVLAAAGQVAAQDLVANEKKVSDTEFLSMIPKDKILNVDQFKKVWEEVMAGKLKAYLIDVRSHPEYYAFHIEGTDHIDAGHMYTIPKKIPDPNADIYVFCRTNNRAVYVAGFLYKYGYKNVHMFDGGVVQWAKAGMPFVNQFTGKFQITDYSKETTEAGKYRTRMFHPY